MIHFNKLAATLTVTLALFATTNSADAQSHNLQEKVKNYFLQTLKAKQNAALKSKANYTRNTNDATFRHGEHLAINLILALAFKDKVQFFVGFMRMKKTTILTRNQRLERHFATCCLQCLAHKHLSRYFNVAQRQYINSYLLLLSLQSS